jgi:Zn finger protein HypA/HybF involved in hydrogenase expression
MCDKAEFIMNVQKLKLHCNGCCAEFEIDEHRYKCLECDSLDVKVIDGEDMYLMSLEME